MIIVIVILVNINHFTIIGIPQELTLILSKPDFNKCVSKNV